MANSDIFSGQCTSRSHDADRHPRTESEEIGEYYCYLCGGSFNRGYKKKLYFGYDITVCIGECDERWSKGMDKHGFPRKV